MNEITPHDYFMAHAPKEIAPWFKHEMSPKPKKVIPDGTDPNIPSDFIRAINHEEICEWNAENYKQHYIQWPGAWADEMMKQRRS